MLQSVYRTIAGAVAFALAFPLAATAQEILADPGRLSSMAAAATAQARPNAAAAIAAIIQEVAAR